MSEKPEGIIVFMSSKDDKCNDCGNIIYKSDLIQLSGQYIYCLECADLGHLIFLRSGNQCVTRRARKHSNLCGIVFKYSQSRKRSERKGLLVEPNALEIAEQECANDAGEREIARAKAAVRREKLDKHYILQFANEIRRLYPKMPRDREFEIADHACEKYSGRVGRSCGAKELNEVLIDRAVVAHIRHTETKYDELLMNGYDRNTAREMIRGSISNVLIDWTEMGDWLGLS